MFSPRAQLGVNLFLCKVCTVKYVVVTYKTFHSKKCCSREQMRIYKSTLNVIQSIHLWNNKRENKK